MDTGTDTMKQNEQSLLQRSMQRCVCAHALARACFFNQGSCQKRWNGVDTGIGVSDGKAEETFQRFLRLCASAFMMQSSVRK